MNLLDIKKIPLLPYKFRLAIIGIICLIFFALIYFLQITSALDRLETSRKDEVSLRQQFESAINKQVKLQEALAGYNNLKKQFQIWQDKLVTKETLLDLINDILKIGAKNKLIFKSFDPGDQLKEGNYFKTPIRISIAGGYHEFATFISEVANLPWIVSIKNFTINNNAITETSAATPAVTPNDSLTTELMIEIYQRPEVNLNANQPTV